MLSAEIKRERGFTLVELMISVAIGGIVLAGMVTSFAVQRHSYRLQGDVSEMIENARVGLDIMTGDIRMAGYDPGGGGFNGIGWNCTLNPPVLEIRTDWNGDTDYNDTNERIYYRWVSSSKQLQRRVGSNGSYQPFIEDVESCTFQPRDGVGNNTCIDADIREVEVTIKARTPAPDPAYAANNGYRTLTLTSRIYPRNLADRIQ